jgi:hypothetical protein
MEYLPKSKDRFNDTGAEEDTWKRWRAALRKELEAAERLWTGEGGRTIGEATARIDWHEDRKSSYEEALLALPGSPDVEAEEAIVAAIDYHDAEIRELEAAKRVLLEQYDKNTRLPGLIGTLKEDLRKIGLHLGDPARHLEE